MSKQINVTYDPFDGNSLRLLDGAVETSVRALIKDFYAGDKDIDVTYGSSLPITMFRVFIKEGVIAVDDIQFIFEGAVVTHDSDGRIAYWPRGFCDIDMDLLDRIL